MADIVTPNLAEISRPYADDAFNNLWKSVYGFKDTVRTDYLKDAYVPAKEVGARLDYLNNRYALESNANTYSARMADDFYGAQLGAAQAEDDYSLYGTVRPYEDSAAASNAALGALDAQDGVAVARSNLEQRVTEGEANQRHMAAPGNTPWDKATNAYTTSLDDPQATPQVRELLRARMIETLRQQLAVLPPNSPQYNYIRRQLITLGGWGVNAAPTVRGPYNAPPVTALPPPQYGTFRSADPNAPALEYGSFQ